MLLQTAEVLAMRTGYAGQNPVKVAAKAALVLNGKYTEHSNRWLRVLKVESCAKR